MSKKAQKTVSHPWRACPLGEHWREASKVKEHLRKKRRVRAHFRKGSCVANLTNKDQIYAEEIQAISEREFRKLQGSPNPDDLGSKNGNLYDHLIRGWTKYWNEVLKPNPRLDPNLVKALIMTESSFRESIETKVKNKSNRAYGLMQVIGMSFKIMQDERGEIKDHYINLTSNDYKNPSANIAAGIRWLIHKYELHKKNHPKADWIDAIAKYKKYPRQHKEIIELENFYNRLKNFKN
jgi:Transglycosylase SLT domain